MYFACRPVENTPASLNAQGAFDSGPQKFVVPSFRFQYLFGPTVIQVGAEKISGTPVYFLVSTVGTIPISTSKVSPRLPSTTVDGPEAA